MRINGRINRGKMYFLGIIVGLFCIIYNPPLLQFGEMHINSMHVVGTISIVYLLFNLPLFISMMRKKSVLFLLMAFLVCGGYLFLVAIMSEKGDLSIVYMPIYFLVDVIPFGLAISVFLVKYHMSIQNYIDFGMIIAIIQAIIAITTILYKPLQDIIVQRFVDYGYGEIYVYMSGWRIYGFAGGLTFTTAVFQGIFAVVALNQAVRKEKKFIVSLLLMASAIINARVAIVVILVGCGVIVFLSDVGIRKRISRILTIVVIAMLGIIILFPIFESRLGETLEWVTTGLKEIVGFFKGDAEDGYFAYALDKQRYKIPSSLLARLFGEGHMVMGGMSTYGVGSDVGYINDIWKGGFIFLVTFYLIFFLIIIRLVKSENVDMRLYAIVCLFVLPIVNIKGPIFAMNDVVNYLVIMYIVACCVKQEKKYG